MSESIESAYNIMALRDIARRRLPRAIFDFVDGGAEDELTISGNQEALDAVKFTTRVLTNLIKPDLSISVMNRRWSMPLAIGPTGFTSITWPKAELHIAQAAAELGVPYCLSTFSCLPIEVVRSRSDVDLWFQVYMLRDRDLTYQLVDRAKTAELTTLVVTVDNPTSGRRERDLRNSFFFPFRYTPKFIMDALRHPHWLSQIAVHGIPTFPNLPVNTKNVDVSMATKMASLIDGGVSWDDLKRLRDRWSGRMILKGVLSVEDSIEASKAGMDGIILSNHGGRQLDNAIAPIDIVGAVREAVGNSISVLMDGGVRRGRHVAAAVARGATAVLIGRAAIYGVAAGGLIGTRRALHLLRDEYERVLLLSGARDAAEVASRVRVHARHESAS